MAGELFADHGFDDVTMAEIAGRRALRGPPSSTTSGPNTRVVEAITETVLVFYREMLDEALADETTPTPDLIRRSPRDGQGHRVRSARSSAACSARSGASSWGSTRAGGRTRERGGTPARSRLVERGQRGRAQRRVRRRDARVRFRRSRTARSPTGSTRKTPSLADPPCATAADVFPRPSNGRPPRRCRSPKGGHR